MKDSTVKDLDELHRQARSGRRRFEPVWFLNLSYYLGNQWTAWDGNQLYKPKLRKNRVTIVDNRIQPAVRTEVAKLTKTTPAFTVTPETPDEQDVNAAQIAEQIMRFSWKHLHIQDNLTKALLWSRICGAGFIKVFWDKSLGDGLSVLCGPDGQPLNDPNGRPLRKDTLDPSMLPPGLGEQIKERQINMGDVRLEVRSPFQMFVDPIAELFTEAEWIIEESIKSAEYVKQRYGADLEPDTPANPGLVEGRMAGYQASSSAYKGIKVREYWCRPCSTHPSGRRAVWAKDKLLSEESSPFDCQPYIMFSGIPVPGRLWPTSIVEQLRGPQDELNKVKSQIAENRNRVGNPTILASKQAVQDPETFEGSLTRPGGVYYYDDTGTQNAVPTFLEPPVLQQWTMDEIQRIEESIEQISGQHEVTSASVPPGVTAASAINLLQESDDTRLGPAVKDLEAQLSVLGQKILQLIANFYTDSRTIRIAGEENSWEIFDFRGSQLRENTHVEVQAGSAYPQSKAAKQAAMQDLLTFFVQSGNPPHGRQLAQFLKDWEVGGAERLLSDYTRDETQINRENQKLLQGTELQINSFDNDQAHITGHEDEQKSMRYESSPPQIKAVMEQHVQAHRERMAQQQAQQAQNEMQLQGQDPQQQMAQQQQEGQLQLVQKAAEGQQQMQQQAAQGQQQLQQAHQQMGQQQDKHVQDMLQAAERHRQQLEQQRQQAQMQQRQQAQQQRSRSQGGNGR